MTTPASEFRVMSSGAFGPAYLSLRLHIQSLTGKPVITASTSLGFGENTLEKRLQRGEVVDVVIVAEALLKQFIDSGLVLREGSAPLARSTLGLAVREGAPKPDISTVDALRSTLLQAKSIGYSPSVSGQYLTTQLLQRLGIADQVLAKCHMVSGGVGVVVAHGELEIAVQQMSELLPVQGLAHVTPLPADVQIVSTFSAGVAANCPDAAMARQVIQFLAGPQAAAAIVRSGLEPAGN